MRAEDRTVIQLNDIIERYAEQAEDALMLCQHEITLYCQNYDRKRLQHVKLILQNAAEMIQKYQDKLQDMGG